MSTFVAPTVAEIQNSGQHGNLSVAQGTYTHVATQINDLVYMVRLYAGTKVTRVRLINAALGAGTTADVGFKNVNGEAGDNPTAFLAAQATSTAGATESPVRPVVLPYDAWIIVTIKGGVAAGLTDVVVEYDFRGK